MQQGKAQILSSEKVVGDPGNWNVVQDNRRIIKNNIPSLPALSNKFKALENDATSSNKETSVTSKADCNNKKSAVDKSQENNNSKELSIKESTKDWVAKSFGSSSSKPSHSDHGINEFESAFVQQQNEKISQLGSDNNKNEELLMKKDKYHEKKSLSLRENAFIKVSFSNSGSLSMERNYAFDRNEARNCVSIGEKANLIDEFTNDVEIKKTDLIPNRDEASKYFPIRDKVTLMDKPEVNEMKIMEKDLIKFQHDEKEKMS